MSALRFTHKCVSVQIPLCKHCDFEFIACCDRIYHCSRLRKWCWGLPVLGVLTPVVVKDKAWIDMW